MSLTTNQIMLSRKLIALCKNKRQEEKEEELDIEQEKEKIMIRVKDFIMQHNKEQIDINLQDEDGFSALRYAIVNNNIKLIKLLIDNFKNQINKNQINSSNPVHPPLMHLVCYRNNIDIAKLLIDNFKDQIDINFQDRCDRRKTALMCVDNDDDAELFKLLIDNFKDEIDINLRDIYGGTVLHYAINNDHDNITQVIIDNFKDEIDINILSCNLHSVMHITCLRNNINVLKLLIDNFKDKIDNINLQDEDGFTCLHLACWHEKKKLS